MGFSKKSKVVALSVLTMLFCIATVEAQEKAKESGLKTISKNVVQAQLEFLASDWTEGREAGSKGNKLAADYLSSVMKLYGVEPCGDEVIFKPNRYQKLSGVKEKKIKTYFQPFTAVEVSPSNNHSMSVIRKLKSGNETIKYDYKTDFSVPLITESRSITAPIVFVGYGYTKKSVGYDDFKGVDVKGKIIVRLSQFPGWDDTSSVAYDKIVNGGYRAIYVEKNRIAMEKGAIAILEYDVKGDNELKWTEDVVNRYNGAMYEGDSKPESFYSRRLKLPSDKHRLPVVNISEKVLKDILKGSKLSLEKIVEKSSKLKSVSKEFKNSVTIKLNASTRRVKLNNIIGKIEGENPNEILIVGAHYDHLGKQGGYIFNGADDNGSGVVAVTTIARAFKMSGVKPYRTVIFALWDGEERGLLGSREFIRTYENMGKVVSYLNFDMVGRNYNSQSPGNKVSMIYTKAFNHYVDFSKKNISKYGLNLDVNFSGVKRPVSGSDNVGFAKREIPIFWFHTGGHVDYHQASDHVEMINWEKFTDIIRLSYLDMWDLANDKSIFK